MNLYFMRHGIAVERDAGAAADDRSRALTPKGIKIFNPAFDVTSHDLISALITEKGVIRPPFRKNIRTHVGD